MKKARTSKMKSAPTTMRMEIKLRIRMNMDKTRNMEKSRMRWMRHKQRKDKTTVKISSRMDKKNMVMKVKVKNTAMTMVKKLSEFPNYL